MNWGMIGAMSGACAVMGAAFTFVVNALIQKGNTALLKDLDEIYMRKDLAIATFIPRDHRATPLRVNGAAK